MFDLTGMHALVTGASGGIGSAIAKALHTQGATVALSGTRAAALETVAAELGDRVHVVPANLSDREAVEGLVPAAEAAMGGLDILVNNAGIQLTRGLEETSLDDWHRVMNINADSAFLGTRMAIGIMKTTGGGSIVNLSSTFGIIADGLNAAYCASKAAVRHFTKAAALYCADRGYGIRVNSVHPGLAWTPMLEREIVDVAAERGLSDTSSVRAEWNRICPLGVGTAGDIAEGILYLASDASKYVTGSELVIDGGHIIR